MRHDGDTTGRRPQPAGPRAAGLALLALLLLPLAGCSSLAAKLAAGALTSGGDAYASDDDPELVRGAVPFGLKTMEGVLESEPRNVKLLQALASGFTQYGYAFVASDAEVADLAGKLEEAKALRLRAKKLFLRAREYGLRGLDARRDGLGAGLRAGGDLAAVLATAKKEDVPLLYWTASAWTLAIVNAKGDMGLVAELPVPVAMMERALALDEAWGEGAIHEFFLAYLATRTAAEGGGPARARTHLDRALALSMNKKLGPRVAYAEGVLVQAQDRAAFTAVLEEVLAANPDEVPRLRLANVLAQRKARLLLNHADDLFLLIPTSPHPKESSVKKLVLAALLAALAPAAGAQVTIKLGTLAPAGSTWHEILKEMGQKWEAASGGQVKLRVYAGGAQGSEGDMVRN